MMEIMPKVPTDAEQLRSIRERCRDDVITPKEVHYIDVSIVNNEVFFDVVGFILTTLGALFVGKSIRDILAWIILVSGFLCYAISKIWFRKRINKKKITLDDYLFPKEPKL